MKSRVTTKVGDAGTTRALDGETYSKAHRIMDAVGATDGFRAQTALLRQQIVRERPQEWEDLARVLLWLVHTTFPIGTECSDPRRLHPEYRQVELEQRHIERLETEQARLEQRLDLPKSFIATASNPLAAQADIAAVAARDLERALVHLKETVPELKTETLFPFVNRCSDYLYILARFLEEGHHLSVDYGLLRE